MKILVTLLYISLVIPQVEHERIIATCRNRLACLLVVSILLALEYFREKGCAILIWIPQRQLESSKTDIPMLGPILLVQNRRSHSKIQITLDTFEMTCLWAELGCCHSESIRVKKNSLPHTSSSDLFMMEFYRKAIDYRVQMWHCMKVN